MVCSSKLCSYMGGAICVILVFSSVTVHRRALCVILVFSSVTVPRRALCVILVFSSVTVRV